MTPTTFETAIITTFTQEYTEALVMQDLTNNPLPIALDTENIEVLYSDVMQLVDTTISEVNQGSILLIDLIKCRQAFHQIAKKIADLEIKEKQDVINLEEDTKWHERSKFIRLFVSSEAGNQFDQEKEEAKTAERLVKQFADKLADFESFIDTYILNIGAANDHNFLTLVEEWKDLSKLKDCLISAKKHIEQGQLKLKTSIRCSEGSHSVNNDSSKRHFSFAINQLKEQINIFKPVHEQLTEKVASKISQVRNQLLLK